MLGLNEQPQLHDIVSAPAASWWPLAPGWYALALATTVLLVSLVWWLLRSIRQRRARKAALRQLYALQQQPAELSLSTISLLLKQAAKAYYPASSLHNTQTKQWWLFLQSQLSNRQQQKFHDLLNALPQVVYQPPSAQQPWLADYHNFAQVWLQ